MENPRLFVALDLSIAVTEQLIQQQKTLQEAIVQAFPETRVRWVAPANIHATIKYLGAVEAALVPWIEEVLENIAKPLFPFQIKSSGVGCFPDAATPRIIWSGLDKSGAEVLTLLNQMVVRELGNIGMSADPYDYNPHITLGRVKSKQSPDFTSIVEQYEDAHHGTSTVKDMILFESKLKPEGPEYIVRKRFTLGSH